MCGEGSAQLVVQRVLVLDAEATGVPRGYAERGLGIGEGLWRDPPVVVGKGEDVQWRRVDQPGPVHMEEGWRGLGAAGALGATRWGTSALSFPRHWGYTAGSLIGT